MDSSLALCPHCGLLAQQIPATPRILTADEDQERDVWIITDDAQGFRPFGDEVTPAQEREHIERQWMNDQYVPHAPWQVSLCAACKRISLWHNGVVVYPPFAVGTSPAHPDMPARAAELYQEAAAVLSGSRRAAAALARASLEALLKDVDETPQRRRDLNVRIGELRPRINSGLWKVLTALRVVGNDALHGNDDELIAVYLDSGDAELAETFLSAINELVEELVTRPRKADALYEMIPESKRQAAERAALRNGEGR